MSNFNYLLYCNITIDTSVGVITKVNGVFVFYVNNSKKLIYLITFTMIANSC